MINFTPEDLAFMRERGSNPDVVQRQFAYFEKGFDYARLDRAATLNDGIVRFEEEELEELERDYAPLTESLKVEKFVPASGAASRMFKDLYACLSDESHRNEEKALAFLSNLPAYPFYEALKQVMLQHGLSIEKEVQAQNYKLIISYLLTEKGLNYSNLPKGLLLFHRYPDQIRTAVEEHLVEAALYAQNQGQCFLHFTVSPQHKQAFHELLDKVIPPYEQRFQVRYHITLSVQNPATDTLAAELDNTPFRDEHGKLLFRPAGHGALIHNLNDLDADLVFIKNIDNVATEDKLATTVRYKKAMAAYLLQLKHRIHSYVKILKKDNVDNMMLCEILDFMESDLMIQVDDEVTPSYLLSLLHRPIRVCGMVKNEGEPGGGPYWVEGADGQTTLQIVESSQINRQNEAQEQIMQQATHFNPVDLVCSIKDDEGKSLDLTEFVDPEAGFISSKSYGERTLKAMELPGLWNGAMSQWITLFVEVPVDTFNPVKTVFDLNKADNPV